MKEGTIFEVAESQRNKTIGVCFIHLRMWGGLWGGLWLAVIVQRLGHCVVGAITQVRILVTALYLFFFFVYFH